MTTKEKLAVINSMRIVDADISGGESIYAVVNYNEENIEKLAKVVPDVDEYIRTVGDPDGTKESIDISAAAFQYAGADYYNKGIFRMDPEKYTEYQIQERLSNEDLISKLEEITAEHGGNLYRSDGDIYYTGNATVVNINGVAYWGITYHPLDKTTELAIFSIPHTRPLHEFLDGRFTKIYSPF